MIAHGLPVYVALEPVDMRFGYERLGGIVRERECSRASLAALFVFVGGLQFNRRRGIRLDKPPQRLGY